MTLLIAAKAGPGLKPNGTSFVFEPGIVIAADTRLSHGAGTATDDGLKVGIAGSHAICGMASDSIDIPTQAFHHFDGFMEQHSDISAMKAAGELQRLLGEAHRTILARLRRSNLQTTAFFGHRDPSTGRLSLYRLDSGNSFLPQLRDGFNAAGSHAEWVLESFHRIKKEYPTLTLHQFDGFPGNRVTIREGVAALVMTLIKAAIEVAQAEEKARSRKQAIGGAVQAAIITADGPKVANPNWYEQLKTWQIHEGRLA